MSISRGVTVRMSGDWSLVVCLSHNMNLAAIVSDDMSADECEGWCDLSCSLRFSPGMNDSVSGDKSVVVCMSVTIGVSVVKGLILDADLSACVRMSMSLSAGPDFRCEGEP